MKLLEIAVVTALLLSGTTAYAQKTSLPGGPGAKQWVGDPMIKEPTADQLKRNPSLAKHDRGPTGGYLGGQPGERQR